MKSSPSPASPESGSKPKVFHAGTLVYTKPALVILFFWLIWGDFCYTVMEAVTGPIMQLKFKTLGASNTEIGLIVSTLPWIVYSILNPIISFKSDRFRSRWGRRIPFIVFSLPFLVFFLVCLGFGDRMGFWIHAHLAALKGFSANQVVIVTLGVLLVVFTFFNTFVTSTFWYLFNDVVPEFLLARFMSWFRVVSLASSSFYNFFIFPHSASHATEIFLGAALLYLVGFGLMCLNVREGKYPPPPPYMGGQTGPIAAIRTFGRETHGFPLYRYLWINTFIGAIGTGATTFTLYFQLAIGLTLAQIGLITGTVSIIVAALTVGTGWLADRYHPIRVVLSGMIFTLVFVVPANLSWLFWYPSPQTTFWVAMAIGTCLSAPAQALVGMWDPPMLMRLFPRTHYGQFCSINGVWKAVGTILGGVSAGAYLDFISHWVGQQRAYYYLPVYSLCFSLPAFYFFLQVYRDWHKHGGDKAYVAPLFNPANHLTPVPEASLVMAGGDLDPANPLPLPDATGRGLKR